MGKKKKFIDKKTAHHFYVMHRSQQDPLYYKTETEGGSKLILHPANERTAVALEAIGALDDNTNSTDDQQHVLSQQMSQIQNAAGIHNKDQKKGKVLVDEMGFPLDGYDYSKHLATVTGSGTFISRTGEVFRAGEKNDKKSVSKSNLKSVSFLETTVVSDDDDDDEGTEEAKSNAFSIPKEVLASSADQEYDRNKQLNAITLREDTMDDDIAFFLADDIDVDVEENPDMLMDDDFMQQLIEAEKSNPDDGNGTFDLDAHVAALIEQAEGEEEEWGEEDFQPKTTAESRPRRDIDEHFDAVFEAQYGDDEIGELEDAEFDETVAGEMDPESDRVVEVLTEHLNKVKIEKGETYKIKEGFTEAAQQVSLLQDDDEEKLLDNPDAIVKHFGYENKPKPKFDCETIVSTYSILDNHPTLISGTNSVSSKRKLREGKRRARQIKRETISQSPDLEEESLDDFDDREGKEYGYDNSVPSSVGRPRDETNEEKKMRKRILKDQRRLRRFEKKTTTAAFKAERNAQVQQAAKIRAAATAPPGVSTFKL
mmetsp:Transcript_13433/g.15605  ORF Transcript_13433/g.15605 Transcript_13433/m.15605 type:complete len:540 (-) Transcript_13433:2127-3746(-)